MKSIALLLSVCSNKRRRLDGSELEQAASEARSRLPRGAGFLLLTLVWMFLWSPVTAKATAKTSTGTGNWNTAGTWSPSGVPANGDDVTVAAGHNVTLDTNTNTLASLTVNGTLTVGNNATGRTVTVSGDVSVASGGTLIAGATNATHTMNTGGNLTNGGTFDGQPTGNRVINVTFNGSANQTVTGTGATTRFNTITVNNSVASNTVDVSSSNFAAAGSFLTLTKGIFKMSGSFTFSNTFFTPAGYTIPANTGLWINNSNVTVTAQNQSVTLNGLLRISAGTYNAGTGNNDDFQYGTGSTIDVQGGALNIAGGLHGTATTDTTSYSQSGGTVTLATQGSSGGTFGSFDIRASGSSFTMSAGTIVLQEPTPKPITDYQVGASTSSVTGGTLQIGNASSGGGLFDINSSAPVFNLTVFTTNSPTARLVTNPLTVKGSVSIQTGATLNANNLNMSVAGDWSNSGSFTQGTATVTLNGTSAQAIQGSTATTFHNLTISNTSATVSANTNFNVDGTGTLTVNSGALLSPAAAVVVNSAAAAGTITGSGTIQVTRTAAIADYVNQFKFTTNTLSSMTVDYAAAGAQTINSTVGSYGALKTSNSGTKTLQGAVTVNGGVTIGSGTTLDVSASNFGMNVGGDWANNGGTFTQRSGTVTLNGTAAQAIAGSSATTFHNLTISNSSATVSANTNFNIDGTGTLTVNSGATLIPAAAVVINSAAASGTITGSGTIQVTRTAATADYVNQFKLTTNTLTSMTVDYAGAGAQTINSTVGNYGALKTSSSGTKTLEGAVAVNGGVTIGSGTTLDVSASNFAMNVGGDWTNNGGTFTPRAGTVTFNSTTAAQAINGTATTQTFNNLVVSKTGQTLSIAGNTTTLTLNGGLTISAGTLSAGTATTINIAGDWSNSGAYTAGSSNVIFNGSTAQTIGGSQATTFNGLKISNSAGVTLAVNATVNGVLDLATGDMTTASFTLNQAGTSAGNGDVVGNVKRTDLNGGATRSFGNQYVQITRTAGTVVNININLVKGALNNDFTNSIKRLYTITTTGASGLTANVQLHYLDSELNGNTEDNTLQLWRKDASTWNIQGADASGGNDFSNNWVKLSGVTQFSPWTIAGPSAPTDVTLVSFKATRHDDRVLLEWETGYEVNNVGFNIYREKGGNLSRINPEPVAGSALMAGPTIQLRAGYAYSWWDNDAGDDGTSTRYWLEDIDMSGRTTNHGPFGIDRPSFDDQPWAAVRPQATLLSAFGRDASEHGSTIPVEPTARMVKPTAMKLQIQAGVASLPAVKLSIQREGWYRVTQPELVAAGLPANVDPRKLQLFVDGSEIPMTVTGEADGQFDPGDAVEFYAVGINSPFTAKHVYWVVAGSLFGLRTQHVETRNGPPAGETFPYTVERRDKLIYVPALKNGGAEKFFGPLIYNAQPTDQSLTLQHAAMTGADATLDVSLQGFTQSPHSVRVLFNGKELGVITFNGLQKGSASYSIPQSSVREGNNQVQLISPPGFTDISLAEYVRLTYLHTNAADANSLRFPATGTQQVTLTGFTSSSIRVIDVTNMFSVQEIDGGAVKPDGSTFSVTFNVPGTGPRTLLAFATDQQKKPVSMVANRPSYWHYPGLRADYVVVTRKDMVDNLQPLLVQRKDQGFSVIIIDIDDIYAEFSFGNKNPQALKDFFIFAKSNWARPPRFALLAGDATFDPKNYTGLGDFDLVPTKLVETAFNETATDDWFVDFNGDAVPDIAIGRLPVRTPQETAAMVSKILGYDKSAPTNSVLLVADQNEGFDFEWADSQLQTLIPKALTMKDIRRGQLGDAAARSQLLDALNQGQKLVNFYGHGSTKLWTSAPLLTTADAASLTNRDRLALFDSMTCLNGFFHDPSIESLGESLLKAQGGAIAVWASSGMTDAGAQVQMNQEAIRLLFSGAKLTIGEVSARAKAAVNNIDVRRTWILLGDPATRLR